jgi:hypothetical protein
MFVAGFTEDEVAETIRTYNSHLARIEVITYKDLLDGAARALAWTAELVQSESEDAAEEEAF